MTKRHRSAVDGRYVSEAEAKADPERTVSERVASGIGEWAVDFIRASNEANEREAREKAELLARLDSLEGRVATLYALVEQLQAQVGK